MRVVIPAETPNPFLAAPEFEAQWRALLKRIGALATYPREQGRLQHVKAGQGEPLMGDWFLPQGEGLRAGRSGSKS